MNNENYEEDWAIYFSAVNENQTGSILVDLGLYNFAPVESKPYLVSVITFMNNPTEDGLSSADENALLNQIEDYFIKLLVSTKRAIYTGRLKYGGKILSYFYSEKTDEIEEIISKASKNYADYRFEYNVKEEKDWRAYFEVLYPSPIELQSIQNRRVVENLERHGDKLEIERQVDHWIYFSSEADRKGFLDAIKDDGFKIVNNDQTDSEEAAFSLQLSRIDRVDYQSVDEYVLYLWEKAQEFNGTYDGWETFIIKD
jgi:uncharacterized protein (TIGR01619 family)